MFVSFDKNQFQICIKKSTRLFQNCPAKGLKCILIFHTELCETLTIQILYTFLLNKIANSFVGLRDGARLNDTNTVHVTV